MTTEIDSIASNCAYSARMKAQSLIATGDDRLYFDVLFAIEPSVEKFAVHKNVPVSPEMYLCIAAKALDQLSNERIAALSTMNPDAILHFQFVLSRILDVFAAGQVCYAVSRHEGFDPPDGMTVVEFAECWVERNSDPTKPAITIWPDIEDAVKMHLEAARQAGDFRA